MARVKFWSGPLLGLRNVLRLRRDWPFRPLVTGLLFFNVRVTSPKLYVATAVLRWKAHLRFISDYCFCPLWFRLEYSFTVLTDLQILTIKFVRLSSWPTWNVVSNCASNFKLFIQTLPMFVSEFTETIHFSNCLFFLSFRCVITYQFYIYVLQKSIFQGLSQEALLMCIQSLAIAGDMIEKNQVIIFVIWCLV